MKPIHFISTFLITLISSLPFQINQVNLFAEPNAVPTAGNIVRNQRSRILDRYGSGQYGASRDKTTRIHSGIDIVVERGEKIFMPITGIIMREVMPYQDDKTYTGVLIKGIGDWDGYELKIFYVSGTLSGSVAKGQEIGITQDISSKYPGITNHIHLEVRFVGILIDPFELWRYSF